MKILILSIVTAAIALPQAKGPTTQEAKECAQNFAGNNNTGTVTCYGVDKKLAEQIGQLVSASKRDNKTLQSISEKFDLLLKEIQNAAPAFVVTSNNQQGGITAGQVTINGGPTAVRISISEVSANVPRDDPKGTVYTTTLRVNLNGPVPKFAFAASAPTLTMVSIATSGFHGSGTAPNGFQFDSIDNAFGIFDVVLSSSKPEHFEIQYECAGVTCVR